MSDNKKYYTEKIGILRTDYQTRAENDIFQGKLKIYDVPFEFRSLPLYRLSYRLCMRDRKDIGTAEETLLLEKQILEDIDECEERYQKSGNLPKDYPWYLLKARAYCLKRLFLEGVIEEIFNGENIPSCLKDCVPKPDVDREIPSAEKDYYLKWNGRYVQANMDALDGKIRIYEVPFEYRSRKMYLMAYRNIVEALPKYRKTERNLFLKSILDDIEENSRRFWKDGNLSQEYVYSDLRKREYLLKIFYYSEAIMRFASRRI